MGGWVFSSTASTAPTSWRGWEFVCDFVNVLVFFGGFMQTTHARVQQMEADLTYRVEVNGAQELPAQHPSSSEESSPERRSGKKNAICTKHVCEQLTDDGNSLRGNSLRGRLRRVRAPLPSSEKAQLGGRTSTSIAGTRPTRNVCTARLRGRCYT